MDSASTGPPRRATQTGPTAAAPRSESATVAEYLRRPAVIVARAAWLVVAAATVGLYVPSVWVGLRQLQGPCPPDVCYGGHVPQTVQRAFADLHLAVGFLGSYMLGLNVAFTLGFAAIAALIFWRRSHDPLALFISLALLIFGAASFGDELLPLRFANPAWQVPVGLLGFLGVAGFGVFLYVFPDGRFVPRWTFLAAAAWALWMLPIYFIPDSPFSWGTWPAPMNLGAWALFLGTFVYAQAYRYRWVSSSVQRTQTKWVVLGIAAAAAGHFGGMLVLSFQPAELASAGAVLVSIAGSTLA